MNDRIIRVGGRVHDLRCAHNADDHEGPCVPASPPATEPPPIYGKQLRADAPVASGTPCKHRFEGYNDTCLECGVSFPMALPNLPPAPAEPLTNPSTLTGNVNNPGLDFEAAMREARANKGQGFGVDSFYRAALNAQVRALIDAAVANAIRTHEAMAVQVCADAVKATRAEYAPLVALVEEWREARKAVLVIGNVWAATVGGTPELDAKLTRLKDAEAALAAWTR